MKITATIDCDAYGSPQIFHSAEEFEAEKQRLWDQINLDSQGRRLAIGWYARQQLRDEYPDRFPCLMIQTGWPDTSGDGPGIIQNLFLYDFTIHEDDEAQEI